MLIQEDIMFKSIIQPQESIYKPSTKSKTFLGPQIIMISSHILMCLTVIGQVILQAELISNNTLNI